MRRLRACSRACREDKGKKVVWANSLFGPSGVCPAAGLERTIGAGVKPVVIVPVSAEDTAIVRADIYGDVCVQDDEWKRRRGDD